MLRDFLDHRVSSSRIMRATLAMACLCACSASSSPSTTNATFATTPLGVAASTTGAFTVTMFPSTSGIARGVNTVEIVITDAHNVPVDGLTFDLVPWMPAMGHGSSTVPLIEPEGSGRYVASEVALVMPGVWQLRAMLPTNDEAVVSVEIQ